MRDSGAGPVGAIAGLPGTRRKPPEFCHAPSANSPGGSLILDPGARCRKGGAASGACAGRFSDTGLRPPTAAEALLFLGHRLVLSTGSAIRNEPAARPDLVKAIEYFLIPGNFLPYYMN